LKKFLRNKSAVSQVIGLVLSLSLMSVVATSSILIVNSIINDKTASAAEIHAQDIANKVVDAVINVCLMKDLYPNVNYSTTVDIPLQLIDKYSYYIDFNNTFVFVNSTDGSVSVKNSLYDSSSRIGWDIKGTVMGTDKLIIGCNRSDYAYKFDFGTNDSSGSPGYTRVTNQSNSFSGFYDDWQYRTPIFISNPLGYGLTNYAILIQLNENNFDHSLVNENLKDIRFTDSDGNDLYFWIEQWYSKSTRTSRIWVNVITIPIDGCTIYMYYGNQDAPTSICHDGTKTFLFFDNFTTSSMSKWNLYYYGDEDVGSRISVADGKLILKNGAAVTAKNSFYINPYTTPYMIETKVRSIGESSDIYYADPLEGSMFVRKTNNSSPPYAPYKHASVFSSGWFERPSYTGPHQYNLAIIYYDSSGWINYTDSLDKPPISEDWYRLKYILNNTNDVAVRYFYENFTVDNVPAPVNYTTKKDGMFGLCIANTEYINEGDNITAFYDWIFVRKFISNAQGERKYSEPFAYIDGVESKNFNWNSGVVYSKSVDDGKYIGDDLVFSSDTAVFQVKNLESSEMYSLLFTIGDPENYVTRMKVRIYNNDVDESIYFPNCDNVNPHRTVWISNIQSDDDGSFAFEFSSQDGYWALNELAIMKGERIIWLKGQI